MRAARRRAGGISPSQGSSPATPTSAASTTRQKRLKPEAKRLNDRIHAMYVHRLDGVVHTALFEKSRTSGARCRQAVSARSNGTRAPTNPIFRRESRFSNWRGTPNGCLRSRHRAKSAACSISYYRTALGGRRSPLFASRSICLRKRSLRPETKMRPEGSLSTFWRIGSAGRIRTYDQPINSRLLYH